MGAFDDKRTKEIPHYEHLTLVDHLRAGFKPSTERDPRTGAVTDPQRDYLTSQAAMRKAEYDADEARKKSGG